MLWLMADLDFSLVLDLKLDVVLFLPVAEEERYLEVAVVSFVAEASLMTVI